jgi:hypothetical protein
MMADILVPDGPALTRRLTLVPAVALIIGQVIGVGIFLTPGTTLRTLASPAWVLAVWIVMGTMAISGALAARFPVGVLLTLLAMSNPLQAAAGVTLVAAGLPAYRLAARSARVPQVKESSL